MTTEVGIGRRSFAGTVLILGLFLGLGLMAAPAASAATVDWKAIASGNSHTAGVITVSANSELRPERFRLTAMARHRPPGPTLRLP